MAGERVQRRLAAILAADVVGYSRLIETDEEGKYDLVVNLKTAKTLGITIPRSILLRAD
jgi:class 3 adenylate cyclase